MVDQFILPSESESNFHIFEAYFLLNVKLIFSLFLLSKINNMLTFEKKSSSLLFMKIFIDLFLEQIKETCNNLSRDIQNKQILKLKLIETKGYLIGFCQAKAWESPAITQTLNFINSLINKKKIYDEFTNLTRPNGTPYSREYIHQLRKKKKGICLTCTLPAVKSGYCEKHYEIQLEAANNRYRKSISNSVDKNTNTQ